MATKTLLTIGEYNAMVEPVGVRYELDRGELIVTPSPVPMHNIICGELHGRLNAWRGHRPPAGSYVLHSRAD